MKDQKLRLVVEVVTKGVRGGFSSASSAVRGFVNLLRNMASSGRGFIDSLAQSVFFLGNALSMVWNAAKRLFDTFIGGARDAARLQIRFKHLTSSVAGGLRMFGMASDRAKALGKNLFDVGEMYALAAVNARDAEGAFDWTKLEDIVNLTEFLSALRPDLPLVTIMRGVNAAMEGQFTSLEMIMDMPIKAMLRQAGLLTDVKDDLVGTSKEIGKAATFITIGAADGAAAALKISAKQMQDAIEAYTGVIAEDIQADLAETAGLERIKAIIDELSRVAGIPVFEQLMEFADRIIKLYEADPQQFIDLATALGDLAASGLEAVFDPLIAFFTDPNTIKGIESLTRLLELLKGEGEIKAPEEIRRDVGAKAREDVGKLMAPWKGILDQFPDLLKGIGGKLGLGASEPQELKITVEVTSDNAMFDAQVRQTAENTVIGAFDAVHQNYQNRAR